VTAQPVPVESEMAQRQHSDQRNKSDRTVSSSILGQGVPGQFTARRRRGACAAGPGQDPTARRPTPARYSSIHVPGQICCGPPTRGAATTPHPRADRPAPSAPVEGSVDDGSGTVERSAPRQTDQIGRRGHVPTAGSIGTTRAAQPAVPWRRSPFDPRTPVSVESRGKRTFGRLAGTIGHRRSTPADMDRGAIARRTV
jgi:hypothetical protein